MHICAMWCRLTFKFESLIRIPQGNASFQFRFDIVERAGPVRPENRRFNRGCERGR